jgi:hypothetical protein
MVVFAAFLLRIVVLGVCAVLLSGATLTLAAERVDSTAPKLEPLAAAPKTLVVPDVTGQAYVFAKGILQDNGFAWHVAGPVQGFAANVVSTQTPVAGTTVIDTGAPTITLALARDSTYLERGTPDNDAPYNGTAIRLPTALPPAKPQPKLEPVQVPPLNSNPLTTPSAPATPTPSLPASPATSTPAATTPAVVPVTPTPTPMPTPTPTPAAPKATPRPCPTAARPPDFVATGAPKEPAKSQPLPLRAQALAGWLEKHRQATAANLNYWLYEHAYIVAGARFGWWHGAEALQTLVAVDQRAEKLWGVGNQSELVAKKALSEVQARAR